MIVLEQQYIIYNELQRNYKDWNDRLQTLNVYKKLLGKVHFV